MTQHEIRTFAIDDLVPFDKNPRRGDVEAIKSSLEHFGQFKTIVVNAGTHTGRGNVVLAGNHTLQAARELGWTELSATVVDVDEATAIKIVLADNRINDRATNNDQLLLELLESLPDLGGTGYEAADLGDLGALLEEQGEVSLEDVPRSLGSVPHESENSSKFKDREEWEATSRRLMVLEYDRDSYPGVVEAFEKACKRFGVASNSEAAAAMLKELGFCD